MAFKLAPYKRNGTKIEATNDNLTFGLDTTNDDDAASGSSYRVLNNVLLNNYGAIKPRYGYERNLDVIEKIDFTKIIPIGSATTPVLFNKENVQGVFYYRESTSVQYFFMIDGFIFDSNGNNINPTIKLWKYSFTDTKGIYGLNITPYYDPALRFDTTQKDLTFVQENGFIHVATGDENYGIISFGYYAGSTTELVKVPTWEMQRPYIPSMSEIAAPNGGINNLAGDSTNNRLDRLLSHQNSNWPGQFSTKTSWQSGNPFLVNQVVSAPKAPILLQTPNTKQTITSTKTIYLNSKVYGTPDEDMRNLVHQPSFVNGLTGYTDTEEAGLGYLRLARLEPDNKNPTFDPTTGKINYIQGYTFYQPTNNYNFGVEFLSFNNDINVQTKVGLGHDGVYIPNSAGQTQSYKIPKEGMVSVSGIIDTNTSYSDIINDWLKNYINGIYKTLQFFIITEETGTGTGLSSTAGAAIIHVIDCTDMFENIVDNARATGVDLKTITVQNANLMKFTLNFSVSSEYNAVPISRNFMRMSIPVGNGGFQITAPNDCFIQYSQTESVVGSNQLTYFMPDLTTNETGDNLSVSFNDINSSTILPITATKNDVITKTNSTTGIDIVNGKIFKNGVAFKDAPGILDLVEFNNEFYWLTLENNNIYVSVNFDKPQKVLVLDSTALTKEKITVTSAKILRIQSGTYDLLLNDNIIIKNINVVSSPVTYIRVDNVTFGNRMSTPAEGLLYSYFVFDNLTKSTKANITANIGNTEYTYVIDLTASFAFASTLSVGATPDKKLSYTYVSSTFFPDTTAFYSAQYDLVTGKIIADANANIFSIAKGQGAITRVEHYYDGTTWQPILLYTWPKDFELQGVIAYANKINAGSVPVEYFTFNTPSGIYGTDYEIIANRDSFTNNLNNFALQTFNDGGKNYSTMFTLSYTGDVNWTQPLQPTSFLYTTLSTTSNPIYHRWFVRAVPTNIAKTYTSATPNTDLVKWLQFDGFQEWDPSQSDPTKITIDYGGWTLLSEDFEFNQNATVLEYDLANTTFIIAFAVMYNDGTNFFKQTSAQLVQLSENDVNYNEWVETTDLFSCTKTAYINGSLFLYDGNIPNRIYFSQAGNYGYFPSDFYIDVPIDIQERITKIVYFSNQYVIFCENSIWKLTGDSPTNYTVTPINLSIGCIDGRSAIPYMNYILFVSNDGIYKLKGLYNTPDRFDVAKISAYINNLVPYQTLQDAFAVSNENKVYFFLPKLSFTITSKASMDPTVPPPQPKKYSDGIVLVYDGDVVLNTKDDNLGWSVERSYILDENNAIYTPGIFANSKLAWSIDGRLHFFSNGRIYIKELEQGAKFYDDYTTDGKASLKGFQTPIIVLSKFDSLEQDNRLKTFKEFLLHVSFPQSEEADNNLDANTNPEIVEDPKPSIKIEADFATEKAVISVIPNPNLDNTQTSRGVQQVAQDDLLDDSGWFMNDNNDASPAEKTFYYRFVSQKARMIKYKFTITNYGNFGIARVITRYKDKVDKGQQ